MLSKKYLSKKIILLQQKQEVRHVSVTHCTAINRYINRYIFRDIDTCRDVFKFF